MVSRVVYHFCPSRLASRLTLTFVRRLTLINSNLIKQEKISFLFRIKLKQFHDFSAWSKKLFVIKNFPTSSSDVYCIWCFTQCSCYMYRVLSHIIYAVTKWRMKSRTRFLITLKIVLDFCFILGFTIIIFNLFFWISQLYSAALI